jgi:hypothetical protein
MRQIEGAGLNVSAQPNYTYALMQDRGNAKHLGADGINPRFGAGLIDPLQGAALSAGDRQSDVRPCGAGAAIALD